MSAISHGPSISELTAIADRIRLASLEATTKAGSGHPTSSLSCADLLAVLFYHAMHFDIDDPRHPCNDRFVLSKGHAAPALWAALESVGAISHAELLSLRQADSDIEGHPTPRNPYIDVPTGSLGQGLSIGLGMTLWSRGLGINNRIWVLLGDGECAEGSVWEAAMLASHYGANRLCAIIDVNRLGQTGETMYGHDCQVYQERFRAFGWTTMIVDGHDMTAIIAAIDRARKLDSPVAIIARTTKGEGVSFLEDAEGMHGKTVSGEQYQQAMAELGEPPPPRRLHLNKPDKHLSRPLHIQHASLPDPSGGSPVATRHAYGRALAEAMAQDERLLAFDAEVSNSTGVSVVKERFPNRFIECYIAEQNMIGMALGAASLGAIPCASSFAAFLSRAADQLRMAGLSGHHMLVAGSHAGISIGEDGPSQMGLEDIALFRAINGASVLCPADGVSCHHLLPAAIDAQGLVYIRLSRPERPLIYSPRDRDFPLGGSRLLRIGPKDLVTVVACGICVHEAIAAADQLGANGIGVRVIDAYSIEPLDIESIAGAGSETGHLITVEDHYRAGGLGEAVASQVLPLTTGVGFSQLAVEGLPRSGDAASLMQQHRIDADAICDCILELLPSAAWN